MGSVADRWSLGANIYWGSNVVQLAGIDQIQAFLAHVLEARQDFVYRSSHNSAAALVSGKVQVKVFAHKPIGHAGETIERILYAVAEQLAAEHVVVERNTQREFHRRRGTFPEVQVILPAGVEEFPLQIGHLNQLRALLLFHARVFERHEECRNESTFRVTQVVKQIERFFSVRVRLSGQADNKGAERKPVMLVQNLKAFENDVAPLMGFVRISLALHEDFEEPRTTGFQANDWIRHALIRVRRFFMLHVRIGNDQRCQTLNDSRIHNYWRHRDVRHL